MNYEISEELLKVTLNYLATRPIQEVDQLFHTLQGLKKIEAVPDEVIKKVADETAKAKKV